MFSTHMVVSTVSAGLHYVYDLDTEDKRSLYFSVNFMLDYGNRQEESLLTRGKEMLNELYVL